MINETPDTVTDVLETINFTRISSNRIYTHTEDEDLEKVCEVLTRQNNKINAGRNKQMIAEGLPPIFNIWDREKAADRICCNLLLYKSVLNN